MKLSCGHEPSPHSEHTTGIAHTPDGREVCWGCSNKMELESMKKADVYWAYVSVDGKRVTTWPGGTLATVIESRRVGHNFWAVKWLLYVRARMDDGSEWYGRGSGNGMCIKLKRAKGKR